jgi:hypothetical protein
MQVADSGRSSSGTRLRVSGAILGGGMSGAVAVIGVVLGVPFIAIVAGIGVVVGTILGAILAPKAAVTRQPIAFALVTSVVAVPVGGAIVGALFAFGIAWSEGAADSLPIMAVTGLFSLPLYPIFAPVVAPITIACILIGRRLLRAEPRTAALVLAGLVVADAALLALSPVIAPWVARTVTWVGQFSR